MMEIVNCFSNRSIICLIVLNKYQYRKFFGYYNAKKLTDAFIPFEI